MLHRSVKILTAAAILGISPALLSAQLPVESPEAQLKSQTSSKAQIKSKSDAPEAPVERVQKRQGTKSQLKTDTKLKTDVDAKSKSRGKTNAPGLTPPPINSDAADGEIKRAQEKRGAKAKVRGKADVDMSTRRKANRPITEGNRQNLQGQGRIEIDAMVRQGTAHLDIDDETRARYRHHNGHWWYRTENDQWLIDNNGQWEPFDPVTYRNPNQQSEQEYYQEQGNVSDDYQTDGSYYYDDNDSYYYGNRGYNNRGNGYYGNRNRNGYGYGNGNYRYGNNNRGNNNRGNNNRGNYNRGQWNNGRGNNGRGNNGRGNVGNRGRSDRRQGAAIGAEIGGALGGNRGARIGAGIGADLAD